MPKGNGQPQPASSAPWAIPPNIDDRVACIVGVGRGPDGVPRILLIWDLPGQRVTVPLTIDKWDAIAKMVEENRASLGLDLAADIDSVLSAEAVAEMEARFRRG